MKSLIIRSIVVALAALPLAGGAQETIAPGQGGLSVDAGSKPMNATLSLEGISFLVKCPNRGSLNPLMIVPAGLEKDNSPVEVEADGTAYRAEVADLNADGSPEIYVYVRSAGSGSYGSLVAYSTNKKKSLSEIYLPELREGSKEAQGYMGHDDFAVVESRLVRRFPIYKEGDNNAEPTGGMRQLQYKLVAGEAGWRLEVDKVVEY